MNDRERREYEMALLVLLFLNKYNSNFEGIAAVAQTVAVLEAETQVLADLGADKVSVKGEAKDKTIHKRDLRDALIDAIQEIADMWRPMAKNYENAQNKFRINYGSDQLLVDTAGSFIEDATPLKTAFTDRGMPDNFITNLTSLRAAFAEILNESAEARLKRIGTNAEFREPLRKCREAVEDVDPIVKMVFRNDPGKLAEWMSASRVKKN